MRVVLDTNILVSALIAPAGKPAAIIDAWLDGKFTLVTCAMHVDELRSTLQKPRIADLIKPYNAGRLVNQVGKLAEDVDPLPDVERSSDPTDDFLLSMSEGGKADYQSNDILKGAAPRRRSSARPPSTPPASAKPPAPQRTAPSPA